MKLINFFLLFLCFWPLQSPFATETNEEIKEKVYDEAIPIPKRKKIITLRKGIHDEKIPIPKRKKIPKLAGDVEAIANSVSKKLTKCWNIPDGVNYKKNFNIKIYLLLSPHGEIVTANVLDNSAYHNSALFRSMADNAMRAVYKCSPFSDLPIEHYHLWREITLNFILGE